MRQIYNKNATVHYIPISYATASTTELVPALAGNRIYVLSYTLVSAGAVTATFKSATDAITGAMSLATGVAASNVDNDYGLFRTAEGEALNLTLSGAVQVSGHLAYIYTAEPAGL